MSEVDRGATSGDASPDGWVGDVPAAAYRLRWLTMAVVIAGTVMVILDTTIVNVALTRISEDLHAGDSIEWVVSAYLVATSVVLPVTGWLGDRVGHKRLYLLGLVTFTLASLLCGLAPTFPLLIAARILQGVGGGVLLPVGLVLILKVFPRQQHGKAIGVWAIAAMASPAVGPTLGGWLVDTVDWHWLFLINVPLGIVTLVAGWRYVPQVPRGRMGRFDAFGFVTGSVGLALLVLGLSEGNRWGWTSPATLGCVVLGASLMAAFVVAELRVDEPMLELGMFRSSIFTLSFGISFVAVGVQYVRLVFVPLELEQVEGRTALSVGLSLAPAAILTAVGVTLGGRIADRVGPRKPIIAGVSTMVVTGFAIAAFGLRSPLWVLIVLLTVQGFGLGIHSSPATVAAMNTLTPDLVGQGSTMRALGSQVSGAVFVAALGAVLTISTPTDASLSEVRGGFEVVFYAAFLALAAALVMALFLRPRPLDGGGPAGDDAEERRLEIEEATIASLE